MNDTPEHKTAPPLHPRDEEDMESIIEREIARLEQEKEFIESRIVNYSLDLDRLRQDKRKVALAGLPSQEEQLKKCHADHLKDRAMLMRLKKFDAPSFEAERGDERLRRLNDEQDWLAGLSCRWIRATDGSDQWVAQLVVNNHLVLSFPWIEGGWRSQFSLADARSSESPELWIPLTASEVCCICATHPDGPQSDVPPNPGGEPIFGAALISQLEEIRQQTKHVALQLKDAKQRLDLFHMYSYHRDEETGEAHRPHKRMKT